MDLEGQGYILRKFGKHQFSRAMLSSDSPCIVKITIIKLVDGEQRVCARMVTILHFATFLTFDRYPSLISRLIIESHFDRIKCILGINWWIILLLININEIAKMLYLTWKNSKNCFMFLCFAFFFFFCQVYIS